MPNNEFNAIIDKVTSKVGGGTSASAAPSSAVFELPSTKELEDVQQALDAENRNVQKDIAELNAATRESKAQQEVLANAIDAAGGSAKVIKATQENAAMQAQNATIEGYDELGSSEAQIALLADLEESSNKVAELLDLKEDIMDDVHTPIVPLDIVINSFRSMRTEVNLDSARAKRDHTLSQIAGNSSALTSLNQMEMLTQRNINEATIQANLDLIDADTRVKKAESKLNDIATNSRNIAAVHQMRSEELRGLTDIYRFKGEVTDRGIRTQQQEIDLERIGIQRRQMRVTEAKLDVEMDNLPKEVELMDLRLEQAQLTLSESRVLSPLRQQKAQADFDHTTQQRADLEDKKAQLVTSVSAGLAVLGLPQESEESILLGWEAGGETAERYKMLFAKGNADDVIIASTPADAVETLAKAAPNGDFARTPVTELLEATAQSLEASYKQDETKRPSVSDKKQYKADFNAMARTMADIADNNIIFGDATNPYQAPPFTVLADKRAVAESTLYQKVLAAKGMVETNPQVIFDAAIDGIRAGVISPELAAEGIATIFQAAMGHNNQEAGGYHMIGYPEQTSYNTAILRTPDVSELIIGSATKMLPSMLIPNSLQTATQLLRAQGIIGEDTGPDTTRDTAMGVMGAREAVIDLIDTPTVRRALIERLSSSLPIITEEGEVK